MLQNFSSRKADLPPVVVVPDGLAINKNGPELSFVFKAVLDEVISNYPNNKIFLAPANTFGTNKTEHKLAEEYLRSNKIRRIYCPNLTSKKYIDTMGNAKLLKFYLVHQKYWPLDKIILVVAKLHAKRAKLCFNFYGFKIAKVHIVNYVIKKKQNLVPRLFYYNYNFLHHIYEQVAYIRDKIRILLCLKKI